MLLSVSLLKTERIYRVPANCLDDYYWMLASISDQTKSRNGADLDVTTDNFEGRWPGTRPMLVSNDQLKDHKLELMEPRLFRRWYNSYFINYSFTAFVNHECVKNNIINFSIPDCFSNEIQGNTSVNGIAWHFPVCGWNGNERLCIRIPL